MKRIGKIINLKYDLGVGEIVDHNDQEIFFEITEVASEVALNSIVLFEIEMKAEGLRAIKITPPP